MDENWTVWSNLVRDEERKRNALDVYKGKLQESWNKLVNLRSHISLLKSSIEELGEPISWISSELFLDTVPDRVNAKERDKLKEALKKKLELSEKYLLDLRQNIGSKTEALGDMPITTEQREFRSMSSNSDLISSYLISRNEIIDLNRQAELALDECVRLRSSLIHLEKDEFAVTALIEKIREEVQDGDTFLIPNFDLSLQEVLGGETRLVRLSGESTVQFKDRLEKRLFTLNILETRLSAEVEKLTGIVRKAQNEVRLPLLI